VDDREIMASYETDWTGRYRGQAGLVLRPMSTEDLAAAMAASTSAGVPIVAQGGNTGLVGGGVPRDCEIVVSTLELDGIEATGSRTEVVVSAGVTLSAVQQHAREIGMRFGIDLAARDSATIGGMIATNAGGVHVVRWGRMRTQILGVEVVLHDGQVLDRLNSPSSRGLTDLVDLIAGSEGTLGIISRARLRLIPQEQHKVVVLLTFDTLENAAKAASYLRADLPELGAVEYFGPKAVDLVGQHRGLRPPFEHGEDAYLLVEVSGSEDPSPALLSALEDMPGIGDSAVAVEPGRQRALWELRESITEAINATGVPQKHDVWLPPAQVPEFARSLTRITAEVGAESVLFGHIAEGSLHANVIGLEPGDRSIEDDIYQLALDLGGSPISEHGVGTAKVHWQRQMLSPLEFNVMQSMKREFDPSGLLNPGVLVPSS